MSRRLALAAAAWRGTTVGKYALGVRVVATDGSRPGWLRSTWRFGVELLVPAVAGLAMLLAVFLRFPWSADGAEASDP